MAELKIPNPADPIRPIDRTVFGANVQRHPITGQPLETGINAATPSQQALNFCDELERHGQQTAADAMRRKLAAAAKFDADAASLKADGVTPAAAEAMGAL